MASYKVIQDVEAEDKLLGPLTFRQFVYAGAAALFGYLCYFLIAHNAGIVSIPFIPIVLISAFFAWPWGRDQPTEIWALAKIRFFFKSRLRIWDQSGVKEMVTITVPKKVDVDYTNGLSQNEVKSRLQVLADTLDSRGWAIKNADPNTANQPVVTMVNQNGDSDRLISLNSMSKPAAPPSDTDPDDVMDEKNNPIAKQFDNMIEASSKAHRDKIIENMQKSTTVSKRSDSKAPDKAKPKEPDQPKQAAASNAWFLNTPSHSTFSSSQDAVTFNSQVIEPSTGGTEKDAAMAMANAPKLTDEEQNILDQLGKEDDTEKVSAYSHLHTIIPLSEQAKMKTPSPSKSTPQQVTQPPDAGILDLASNNDLNVATIQREAQKRRATPQDEVVIKLH